MQPPNMCSTPLIVHSSASCHTRQTWNCCRHFSNIASNAYSNNRTSWIFYSHIHICWVWLTRCGSMFMRGSDSDSGWAEQWTRILICGGILLRFVLFISSECAINHKRFQHNYCSLEQLMNLFIVFVINVYGELSFYALFYGKPLVFCFMETWTWEIHGTTAYIFFIAFKL